MMIPRKTVGCGLLDELSRYAGWAEYVGNACWSVELRRRSLVDHSQTMTNIEDIHFCREIALGFCTELNAWERRHYLIGRLSAGQFVHPKRQQEVQGISFDESLSQHAELFRRYVLPGIRKYGSNPGEPKSWSRDGRYNNVSENTIRSIDISGNRCEIITDWSIILPNSQTMFVLKKYKKRWLVDSSKTRQDESSNWQAKNF